MNINKWIYILKDSIRKSFLRNIDNEINFGKLKEIQSNNKKTFLIDVRSSQEYDEGHLPGAISIPNYELKEKIEKIVPNKHSVIIVYCQTGGRSEKGAKLLEKMGYVNVYNLVGGIDGKRRS